MNHCDYFNEVVLLFRLRSGDETRTRQIVEKLMLSKVDGVVVFVNADART